MGSLCSNVPKDQEHLAVQKPPKKPLSMSSPAQEEKKPAEISELATQLAEAVDADVLFGNGAEKSEGERA